MKRSFGKIALPPNLDEIQNIEKKIAILQKENPKSDIIQALQKVMDSMIPMGKVIETGFNVFINKDLDDYNIILIIFMRPYSDDEAELYIEDFMNDSENDVNKCVIKGIEQMENLYNNIMEKEKENKNENKTHWEVHALEKTLHMMKGNVSFGEGFIFSSALFISRKSKELWCNDILNVACLHGEIDILNIDEETFESIDACHIKEVGNVTKHYNKQKIDKLPFVGCTLLLSMVMKFLITNKKIKSYYLLNVGGPGGCICYVRSAVANDLETYIYTELKNMIYMNNFNNAEKNLLVEFRDNFEKFSSNFDCINNNNEKYGMVFVGKSIMNKILKRK
jgi:hypothetical protein